MFHEYLEIIYYSNMPMESFSFRTNSVYPVNMHASVQSFGIFSNNKCDSLLLIFYAFGFFIWIFSFHMEDFFLRTYTP
jgi:hypothetical protein